MSVLLDSHTTYWYVSGDSKLSQKAKDAIESEVEPFLSAASLWEIAIKVGLGKWEMDLGFQQFLDVCTIEYGLKILPIHPHHLLEASRLPYPTNHRDPFDRMLVAQAISDHMSVISIDEAFDSYGVTRIW